MRALKLKNIVEKTNQWLSGRNYTFQINTLIDDKYELLLFQGPHLYKRQYSRINDLDGHFAKRIKIFIFEALERDLYEALFGKILHVRLDIISLKEHPEDYLKRHKFNILNAEPVTIGDCWILDIIDEGLELTQEMTLLDR